MSKQGLPPLFGAPWERQEEDIESAIPAGERLWNAERAGELAYSARIKASRERSVKWAVSTGLNWDWFLGYTTVGPNQIAIVIHDRIHHAAAGPRPKTSDRFKILEQGTDKWGNRTNEPLAQQRIARAVVLNSDYNQPLEVSNPGYVFDYGHFASDVRTHP